MFKGRILLGMVGVLLFASVARANTLDLGNIVVTPGRLAEDLVSAPANVTVINQNVIEHSNAATVADLLRSVPGVNVTNQGSPHSNLVDIGGYAGTAVSNVLVLVNGRRTNSMDMSGPDWQQIPINSVARIEVIRGGASVLYGDKATGGVVNIITKEGTGKDAATVFAEFCSYASQKYGVEVSGGREKLSYYLYSDYADSKGYRDNSQIRSKDQQARLSYKLNDLVKIGVEGGMHREDYGLPGGLSGRDLVMINRNETKNPDNYGDTADDFIKITSDFTPVDVDAKYGKFSGDYSHRDRHTYLGFPGPGAYYAQKSLIKSDQWSVKHVWKGELVARELNTVTGVDYDDDRNHMLTRGSANDNLSITKRSLGLYQHSEYEVVDHLFVDGGIRHELAKYIFDQYNVATYATQSPRINAYSGGLKYEYANGSNVFFNAQKTFRFLASDEWFQTYPTSLLNTDLKQQTGADYRLGVKHHVNDVLEVSAAPFLVNNKNEIYYDTTNWANSNYGHTRRKGVDLGTRMNLQRILQASFLKNWDVYSNYSYTDARFVKGDYGEKLMPGVPSQQISLGTNVGLDGGLSLDLSGRWMGSEYKMNDQQNRFSRVKPVTVVDTKLMYKMKINTDVYFGVNNLFDEKYSNYTSVNTSSGMPDYYPAPERNYVFGVKWHF